ncbi:hypothetical protein DL96DRAFT_649039 [Flagelloscypha sp. PMI_526]|nr:hypothetical protein DL96DRAFT_649039 [Flagelloscypha sp. PMI_526]
MDSPCHVCSSWRAITLECPTFWNVLLLSNANATRELLIRSKQAPLDVGGHYHTTRVSGQTFVECLSLVLQESYRIEVLGLIIARRMCFSKGHGNRIAESMPAAFEGVEFPTLRQVTLHGDRYTGFPDGYAAVGKALFQKALEPAVEGVFNDLTDEALSCQFLASLYLQQRRTG